MARWRWPLFFISVTWLFNYVNVAFAECHRFNGEQLDEVVMKIPLVGGPYDANVYEINVDINGAPELEVLNMPRKQTLEEGLVELLANAPMAPEKFLRYRLVRVNVKEWIDGLLCDSPAKWRWEYHYEA